MVTNATNFARTRAALRFTQLPRAGNILFADSVAGSATGGQTADGACATLIQAQSLATANADDLVYVGQGHAEAVAGAAGMTFSKAGVTYQGLGQGRLRPTITFGTAITAQIIISGANITFRNFVFDLTGFDAITACFSVTGADVTFEDCDFIVVAAAAAPVLGILTAATAARFRINNCRFLGPVTSSGVTTTAVIKHEVGIDYEFTNNFFTGKVACGILNATTVLGGLIAGNRFHIYTGTEAISLAAASTPFICNNDMSVASGTAPIIAAAASFANNRYTTEGNGPTAGTAGVF